MYSQNSKDKALGVLRLTSDVEKTARMSGVPGRTPRRWAAAAAKRGHEQKSWTDNINPDWSLYAYERTRRAAHRPRQRLSAKPT